MARERVGAPRRGREERQGGQGWRSRLKLKCQAPKHCTWRRLLFLVAGSGPQATYSPLFHRRHTSSCRLHLQQRLLIALLWFSCHLIVFRVWGTSSAVPRPSSSSPLRLHPLRHFPSYTAVGTRTIVFYTSVTRRRGLYDWGRHRHDADGRVGACPTLQISSFTAHPSFISLFLFRFACCRFSHALHYSRHEPQSPSQLAIALFTAARPSTGGICKSTQHVSFSRFLD